MFVSVVVGDAIVAGVSTCRRCGSLRRCGVIVFLVVVVDGVDVDAGGVAISVVLVVDALEVFCCCF